MDLTYLDKQRALLGVSAKLNRGVKRPTMVTTTFWTDFLIKEEVQIWILSYIYTTPAWTNVTMYIPYL